MEKNLKETTKRVVAEILNQYIEQLKSHYRDSDAAYPEDLANTNAVVKARRDNDVIKCGKGIHYAESIRESLDDIMSHKKYWSRKRLIARYHNGKDVYPDGNMIGDVTNQECANNCFTAVDSMGVPYLNIIAASMGYAYHRMHYEIFQEQEWPFGQVNQASFGRLKVNYGRPLEFDVLGGKEGVDFTIDFESLYYTIRDYVVQVLNGCPCGSGNTFEGAFKELSTALNVGGTYVLMTDTNKIKDYQIAFREIVGYKAEADGLDQGFDKVGWGGKKKGIHYWIPFCCLNK